MIRRPSENPFIRNSRQPDILRSYDVEIAVCAEQGTDDVVIEIFVRQPLQHGYCGRRSSNRARSPSGGHRDSFDLLISSPLSVRFARYRATSAVLRRQYPIA